MSRTAMIHRKTNETDIRLEIDLDGTGVSSIDSPVGFLNHMLDLFARHGRFNIVINATGDTHIDDHHTVEDIGIALGMALAEAIGDKRGINRYGSSTLPMDETLVTTAIDLSGRPAFVWNVPIQVAKVGTFDTELAREFWNGVTSNARMNFHAILHHGENAHHIIEAVFKSAARSLRQAVAIDPAAAKEIPSTKGVI